MTGQLELVPENFERAMAIVAHPDDLEYGAASAIARWTRGGRSVAYVIVTDGEAGIDGLDPAAAGGCQCAPVKNSTGGVVIGDKSVSA